MSELEEIQIPTWLKKLIAELKKLRDKERKSDLYSRWLMGKRLNEERNLLKHGEKMEFLEAISKELGEGFSVVELRQRIAFARKYPEWAKLITCYQNGLPSWHELVNELIYDSLKEQGERIANGLEKGVPTPEQFFRPSGEVSREEIGEEDRETPRVFSLPSIEIPTDLYLEVDKKRQEQKKTLAEIQIEALWDWVRK